jgi:hypothetical protein
MSESTRGGRGHPAARDVRDGSDPRAPSWSPPEPETFRSPSDLIGGKHWQTCHDLGEDIVTLDATKEQHL